MRLIAFIIEPPVVERILTHIGQPTMPPAVQPAQSPPQGELEFRRTWSQFSEVPAAKLDAGAIVAVEWQVGTAPKRRCIVVGSPGRLVRPANNPLDWL